MNTWRITALDVAGCAADNRVLDRNITPSEEPLSLFGHNGFQLTLAMLALIGIARKKDTASAILAILRQIDSQFGGLGREQFMGKLRQNAGAVTRFRIATTSAAMGQIDENLQAGADRQMAFSRHAY